MLYAHTLAFATWTDIPSAIRGDCMGRMAPGVYGHLRLNLMLVVLDQVNGTEAITVLMDDVVTRMPV